MARRMLDSGIWANEHFAELCPMARLLQIGIINLADDQGRMKANPAYLRSQVFPYDDVSFDEVAEWLDSIAGNGTVQRYEVDGKVYLQLLNWWEYQSLTFASPSDYPAPTGWVDRIRYTAKGRIILTHNWLSTTGERSPDTCDASGKPIHPSGSVPVPTNGQPPSAPGSVLPSQSGSTAASTLKEDKDKDKDKDKHQQQEADADLGPNDRTDLLPCHDRTPAVMLYEQRLGTVGTMQIQDINDLYQIDGATDTLIAESLERVVAQRNKRMTEHKPAIGNYVSYARSILVDLIKERAYADQRKVALNGTSTGPRQTSAPDDEASDRAEGERFLQWQRQRAAEKAQAGAPH